jgi:amidase
MANRLQGNIPNHGSGAFCRDNHVALAGARSGPLAGYAFGVKDVFDVAGSVTGFGHPDWLRTHSPAIHHAVAVQRLLEAGADLAGRTLSDELAYSLTGENVHYGTPLNPRDPRRVPGGSSSGSASAVACGLIDIGLGTDCGGSVRVPSSYCGLLGMRPTHGRVSLEGVVPFADSFDTVGWMTRDAQTLAAAGSVLLDPTAATATRPRRIVFVAEAFAQLAPDLAVALRPVTDKISAHVGSVGDANLAGGDLVSWCETFRTIQAYEIWQNHEAWIGAVAPTFGAGIRERFRAAAEVSDADVTRARWQRSEIRSAVREVLGTGVILCLPTVPRVAPLRGAPIIDVEITYREQAMRLLCIAGLNGLPQISLPLVEHNGLPLGLSFVGAENTDEALLALAVEVMERMDGATKEVRAEAQGR